MPGSQPNPAPRPFLRRKKVRRVVRRPDQAREEAVRLAVLSVKERTLRQVHAARAPLMDTLQVPYLPDEWTDDDCARIITHLRADWRQIQAHFQGDPDGMRALVKYREKYINGLINELAADTQTYPGLIACASGSKDLASDYDVTLGTTSAGKADALAAAELTRRIKAKFGKQSATVFDTNFYLCDFLGDFENTIVLDAGGAKIKAKAARQATPASVEYQDVLALLKTRRYMTRQEWAAYRGEAARSDIARAQFDRADQIHARNLGRLLARIAGASPDAVLTALLNDIESDEDRLHALDQLRPDQVREVADALCSTANTRLRYLDSRLAALDPLELPDEVAKVRAEIEQVTGDAAFFASEAYHTEGALLHIVSKRDDLTAGQCLDSINEQFGDFVKDVRHYTGERDRAADPDETDEARARRVELANGVMYFRGAKYMSRLLQAIARLQVSNTGMRLLLSMDGHRVDPARLRSAIEHRLMPLRRNPDGRPVEERALEAQVAIRDLFPGVRSPEELKALLTQWVAQVNVAAREAD